jgi:glycine/D-amino acid oxidase-like deaminating enzyme
MTRPLEGEAAADVAIIGAGYTGLSAALHLAETGVSALVLEAEEIGFGGSGRNVGLVNAGMWVMPADLPKVLGAVHGERLLDLLGNAPRAVFDLAARYGIACEVERQGTLHCAVGRKGLAEIEERARQWQARGAPVRVLGAEEAARKLGTTAYAGALLDERAGTIQPLAYARGLAQAAIGLGAVIHTASPVLEAREEGTAWTLRTPKGRLRAGAIILASNAYAATVWPGLRGELVRLPYFNLATRPLGGDIARAILPERQGAWDTESVLSSFRFDRQNRLVFGSIGALQGSGLAIHRAWARRALARLFPQLKGVEFEHAWFGMIGMTDNSLPRFHRLARNVVSFSGYNGRGIAPGTVFGRCLAELVLGKINDEALPLPVSPLAMPAFRGLREALYDGGARLAHLTAARF